MAQEGCSLLRLRGLPYSATEEDVRAFFGPDLAVAAVHLSSKNGKNTGEAYVELDSPAEAKKAMQEKQHQHMGSRYIEIFMAGEAELLAQTSGEGEGARPSLQGHVVRLRGLPFTSTAQDVLQFFEGVETVGGEGGVVFTCTPDGRPTGEAYVAVAGPEAAAAALARHKDRIGTRYIEIFESSRGDMFQAVQQHGYFTTVGGRRRHHWHQQHAGGGAQPQAAYQQDGGGGGARGRAAQMDDMTSAFAGFGLSQRDMQVPGPPRWGAYGAPADQQYQQYGGGPPRGMQQAGAMPAGAPRWRPGAQMVPGGAMQRPGGGTQHFNPAPGPPPGKGGRGSVPNGGRPGGGGYGGYEYGGGGHGGALVFNPFMVQHPLMVQHPQHPGSPWGAAGMMQQQGGAWYGGMQMGRAPPGMQMGVSAHYGHYAAGGYYQPRTGMPLQQGGGGGHHAAQQHGRQQHAPAAGAQQPLPTPLDAAGAEGGGEGVGESDAGEAPASAPAAAGEAAEPASPAAPEQ